MPFSNRKLRRIYLGLLISCIGSLFISVLHDVKKVSDNVDGTSRLGRNTLVNMPDIDNLFNSYHAVKSDIQILFINKPRYVNIQQGNTFIKRKCPFKNCVLTDVFGNFSQMSGIVFNGQDDMPYNGTYLKEQRHDSQVWIIFREEPVGNIRTVWFRDNVWKHTMNWTWGYRLDSDIFFPYQTLITKKTYTMRDYSSIYKQKTKMAAWIVSHCHAKSLRDEYVSALINEGIEVDIYGKCSQNGQRVDGHSVFQDIGRYYKFYLSFENNFCKDYVSEKFFSYLSLDTVLIVRGGLNYSKHFDNNAFIDTSLFPTVNALARYIKKVGDDITLYTKYLQAKDKYTVNGSPSYNRILSICRLCEHMNQKAIYQNTYEDIASYLENGTCFNPKTVV